MKIQSVAIGMCCILGLGGVSNAIIDPPTAIAQTNRNPRPRTVSRGEAVLTDRDPDARINLRTEPSLRSRVRGYGLVGERVEVLKESRSGEGQMWYEVKFLNSGEIGWIPGENIRVGTGGSSTGSSGWGESMRLSQRGEGSFSLSGRRDWEIVQVTVNVDNGDQAELGFRLDDNRLIRLSGDVDRRDAYTLVIDLESSGNADASGTVDIEYGANNSISRIFGDGRLDGQPFSISFDGDRTTGNSNDPSREFSGQNIDNVVRQLRSQGWKVVETGSGLVKLDRERLGMDIKFNPRTRAVTSVRMID
ncbi:MAG: SH3 domain-containing protein [Limnoraphis sp. WC205]|nr:SH3 domain-containing protein [Limnoraphis sp. WC205]